MAPAKEPLTKDTILGLVAMCLAVVVIANDFSALSVALPKMEHDFSSDVTTVQWVINGYALVFGIFIVTGGRLADMFGRRRIFMIGATIFAVFSVIGGLAPDVWVVLVARAIMGIGGALMWPATLGMTYALVPAGRAGLAGGLIMAAAGFGNVLGPLLGGAFTDLLSWRWVFYFNLPVTAFAVLVTWRVVKKDDQEATKEGIDYGGIAALSIGLFALLLSLDLGTDLGWTDPRILGLFGLTVVALIIFGFVERRMGDTALVPDDVLGNRGFFAACIATLLMSAIFFASLLYLPQFMIKVLGYSPLGSGLGMLPMMGTFAVTSFVAGNLYERLGAKIVVSAGAVCLAGGILILSAVQSATIYIDLVPGMVVLGMGIGLFYSSITTAGITALDPSRASLAGAIIYMFQVAGGSIGLGLNTAIVVTAPSMTEGIGMAYLMDGGLAICGLIVAILFVGGRIDKEQLQNLIHRHRAHG